MTYRAQPGTCGTCDYFKPTDESTGECHVNPPILQGGGSVWPGCRWDDWCGQYTELVTTPSPPDLEPMTYDLDDETVPFGAGMVRFASGDRTAPGAVWLSSVDAAGSDQSAALAGIGNGSTVTLTDETDPGTWDQYVAVQASDEVADATVSYWVVDGAVHYGVGGNGLVAPCRVVVAVGHL